jgi:hypothetical protein
MMPGPRTAKSIEERLMYAEHKLAMLGELTYNAAMARDDDRVGLSKDALIGISSSIGDVLELLRPIRNAKGNIANVEV